MNERIKELAIEAGLGLYRPSKDEWSFSKNEEKFADSIVKECAEIALTEAQSNGNFDTFNKIVKHFGVEV